MRWVTLACGAVLLAGVVALGIQVPLPPRPGAADQFTQADAVSAAYADCQRLAPDERKYVRYLWWGNVPLQERQTVWRVLNGHVNSLSRERLLTPVAIVPGTDEALWRVSTLWYRWDPEVWDKFADSDIYFNALLLEDRWETVPWEGGVWPQDGKEYAKGSFEYKKKVAKKRYNAVADWVAVTPAHAQAVAGLVKETGSRAPVVSGTFFFWSTGAVEGRSPTYYDFLGVKDEKTFFQATGAELEKDREFGGNILAAIGKSGVATSGVRAVELVPRTRGGNGWRTLDVSLEKLQKDLREGKYESNPLRVLGTDVKLNPLLKFEASEEIFHLSNGLFAWLAADANGKAQDSVPAQFAANRSSATNDARIHPFATCVHCHTDNGLQTFRDDVRAKFNPALLAPLTTSAKDAERLRQQYADAIEPYLFESRQRNAVAVFRVTGMPVPLWASEHEKLWNGVLGEVTVERAARDCGCKPETILKAIRHQDQVKKKVDHVLVQFEVGADGKPGSLPLLSWWESYSLMQQYLREAGQ